MSFASPVFLWLFMPLTLSAYWLFGARNRNAVLAIASLMFYAYGAHSAVVLLLICIAVNYLAGIAIDRADVDRTRTTLLAVTVVADVSILVYWKYAGFFTRQAADIAELFGGRGVRALEIALPIGISFFTFHLLSYVIDIWRRRNHALHRPLDFVCYIAMFPQLIAGPIVRYHEIADQLGDRRTDRMGDLAAGFPRFIYGLGKKVIIADSIGPIADAVFAQSPGQLTTASAWLGAFAYTLQLYFDFSAYTDMAIGLATMFGFRFPENFARPYSAHSITDFWRRWHITLSRWFRDYVYVPLGGNRGGERTTYRNLIIVFLLTGLWHGAAWTFVLWGLYHGALLIWERRHRRVREVDAEAEGRMPIGIELVTARARTFLLVLVGWVLFRSPDLGHAVGIYKAMIWPSGLSLDAVTQAALSNERKLMLVIAASVIFMPRNFVIGPMLAAGRTASARTARLVTTFGLLPLVTILVAAGTFSPFLYYQF